MKLFIFEFKKIVLTKKFFVALIILIAGVSLLFYRNILLQDYAEDLKRKELSTYIKHGSMMDHSYDMQLENNGKDEEVEKLKELNLSALITAMELRNINGSTDWQAKLTTEQTFLTQTREYKDAGGDHPLLEKEIAYRLVLNEELLERGTPPEYDNYSIAYPNFLKQIVDLLVTFGTILIMIFLIGEVLTNEFESGSINLLFTQPLNRKKIIMNKFFSALIVYLIVTGLVLLTTTIVGKLFGEEGSFHYPIIIEKDGVLTSIRISEFIIQALLLNMTIIFFVIALYLFYSLLFKHTLATLFAIGGSLLAGYGLTVVVPWSSFAWFNVFQYVIPEQSILFQNGQTWYQAIPITILLGIVLVVLTAQKIRTIKIG